MAEIIKHFETYRGRKPYPSEWFDGKSRRLSSSDFGGELPTSQSKINSLRRAAARAGKRLTVRRNEGGTLDIQAIPMTDPKKR